MTTNRSCSTAFLPAPDPACLARALVDARARADAGASAEIVVFSEALDVDSALLDMLEREAAAAGKTPTYLLRLSAPGVERLNLGGVDVLLVRGGRRSAAHWHRDADALYLPNWNELLVSACRPRLSLGTEIFVLDEDESVVMRTAAGMPFRRSDSGKAWQLAHGRAAAQQRRAPGDVLIVGAGLAGALAAYSLHERGVRVSVVDAGAVPGAGASALCAGLAHPHRQSEDSPAFQLARAGVAKLERLLDAFPDSEAHRGVLDLAVDEMEWRQMTADAAADRPFSSPNAFSELCCSSSASRMLGYATPFGGWYYESGRVVRIGRLVRAVLSAVGCPVLCRTPVRLERRDGRWLAMTADGQTAASGEAAVCAAGLASPELVGAQADAYGLSALYGRISILRDTDLPALRMPAAGRGYVVRTEDGFTGAGATYERGGLLYSPQAAHAANLAVLKGLMNIGEEEPAASAFYEGVRATARDRLPLAGPMADRAALAELRGSGRQVALDQVPVLPKCWGFFGLGSRGLSWGLAVSEALAASIVGASVPMLPPLWAKISPLRFMAG